MGKESIKTELIMEVTEVEVTIQKTNPPQLVVKAVGNASSSSHFNPSLERREHVVFPDDGIQEYDFFINVPDGIITTDIKEGVKTDPDVWDNFPQDLLKGVRVSARNNKIEKAI